MSTFLQYVLDGLSIGSIYSLVALGLVIVFRATSHLNIAQGEIGLLCAYLLYQFGESGLPLPLGVLLAVAAGFGLGVGIEVAIVRPLSASTLAVVIATIGVMLLINWLAGAIWGDQLLPNFNSVQFTYPSVFPSESSDFVRILGATWRYEYIGALATLLVMAAGLAWLFSKTRLGLAMRLVASNPDSARLLGVPLNRVNAVSWGLAGAFGAVAGLVFASISGNVSLTLMLTVFLYGATAATLGGFDSPLGAVVAGLSIGVVENLAAGYAQVWVGQEMRTAIAFVALLGVLTFRPSGLFGTARVQRV
ncbi:branched-chain amino acid ABC transporter permease [Nonomuraea sp. NPDC026600]|uniref:branched-chain amino acid ABC transporter permease n=1 Tax=Nonomuraea sp. NPDC026600 TaxID=3155363 RepID=UPI003404F73F